MNKSIDEELFLEYSRYPLNSIQWPNWKIGKTFEIDISANILKSCKHTNKLLNLISHWEKCKLKQWNAISHL